MMRSYGLEIYKPTRYNGIGGKGMYLPLPLRTNNETTSAHRLERDLSP